MDILIRYSLFNFLSNILQPVSEDKRKHPYVIIKDKNNKVSIGFVKKRTHIKKNGEKIECLIIKVCNIEIYLDNSQKAIIQKQECPKMITITQHNVLVLPIFICLLTDGSLANQTISNNDLSHITDNTTVDLGAAFYTNNKLEEFLVYLCLSLWPSSIRAEIVAIFLALLTAPKNSNLKKTNNLINIKIIILIREAAINLKLVKIKGHSGITGNDIADKLANVEIIYLGIM
ncbi:hypothetical protein RhiirA5_437659 [Rhizophagus irregularis]|uniref:Uncharacterized protein n=1 Tax=Rhizophagus irregularis TaxID=588596 RepID=A0A2N0NK71_9GLOM|nr:hypothetical protein RhiirA5_437659 [Rhizophagus irregularis]